MAVDAGKIIATLELETGAFAGGVNTAKGLIGQLSDSAATGADRLNAISSAAGALGTTLTKSLTLPLAAIGTAAVATFTTFDDSIRQVRATMGLYDETNAETAANIEKLTDAAEEMGRTTRYSASEAASALNYLALAGYDAEQAIEALPTVLTLAQAGGMDLAYASDLVTDSMSALGLSMDQLGTFADQLSVTSQKSNTNISQLGQAILTVGATAANLKGGTAELNAELGILADNGIKGAEGGTHLRNVILALTQPTEAGAAAIRKYTDGVYDAEGNMRSLDAVLGELKESLDSMTQEGRMSVINDIFNKTDLAAAQTLIEGAGERFGELTGYINESTGAAEAMADVMEGGLGGSFRNLKSAAEGAMTAIGGELSPIVQDAADVVTGLVNGFTDLDDGTRSAIVTIGGIAAAVGPAMIVISKLTAALAAVNPVVAAVTVGVAALAAAAYTLSSGPKWSETIEGKLGLAIDESELENYRVNTDEIDAGDVTASVQITIHNNAESAYDQIVAILNDGLPENDADYDAMCQGVYGVIDGVKANIEAYWAGKKADLEALFDEGLIGEDEYNEQLTGYQAKQEEMEGQLSDNAAAVTDYIATLIEANRPMTETEIGYLQDLIDKLVDVADQAAASQEAVEGAYRLAYERTQAGVPIDGDTERAVTYVELTAARQRSEAQEKATEDIAALTARADEYTAAMSAAAEGSKEYAQAQEGIAERQNELNGALEGIEERRRAMYQSMAEGLTGDDTGMLESLLGQYMAHREALDAWNERYRLTDSNSTTGLEGWWRGLTEDMDSVNAERDALDRLGDTIDMLYGDKLDKLRDFAAYMQANGVGGEGWDLTTSGGALAAIGDLMGVDPEKWTFTPSAAPNPEISDGLDRAADALAQNVAQQAASRAERMVQDWSDEDYDVAPPGGWDIEKEMEEARERAQVALMGVAGLAQETAQTAEESAGNAIESVKSIWDGLGELAGQETGDTIQSLADAAAESASASVTLFTDNFVRENKAALDDYAAYVAQTGMEVSAVIGGALVTMRKTDEYRAAGVANAEAFIAGMEYVVNGANLYVNIGVTGGGGGGSTTVNNNSTTTNNIYTGYNASARQTLKTLNAYQNAKKKGTGG